MPLPLFQMLVALALMAMYMMPRFNQWAVIAAQLKR